MPSPFSQSFLKKNLWLYGLSFAIAPTGYIVKMILSRDIPIEELGLLYGIISFITILSAYNDFWMTESINYFLPKHIQKKDTKKITQTLVYALLAQFITSTIIAICLWFGAEWLAMNYFKSDIAEPLLKMFIIFFYGENGFKTLTTFFQACENPKLQKSIEFTRMISLVLFVIAIWTWHPGDILIYAWGWIAALFVCNILALAFLFSKYRHLLTWSWLSFSFDYFKELGKYALLVVLSTNAGMLLSQIDMQMIIGLLTPTDAGYYTNYLSIMRIPFMFIMPGIVYLFPVISRLESAWEYDTLHKIRSFTYQYFSIFGIIIACFFFVGWEALSTLLFGEKFRLSWEILRYSCPFLIFNFLLQINFQFLSWTGRVKKKVVILLCGIAFNIIANLILIPKIWIKWAALATWCGWILLFTLAHYANKQFTLTISIKKILLQGFVFILMSYLVWSFAPTDTADTMSSFIFISSLIIGYGWAFVSMNIFDIKSIVIKNKS